MFKKILVPLDGSENAERAIPWVKRYASPSKAQVVLTRSISRDPVDDGPPVELERQEAKDYLLRWERELNYAGIPAKMVVREGPPALSTVREAMEEGCDLIVMTTRGKSRLGRWRVGGVTAQVMRLSKIPVLVVRSQTALRRQAHVRKIVVPLDGSATAESILPGSRPWGGGTRRRCSSCMSPRAARAMRNCGSTPCDAGRAAWFLPYESAAYGRRCASSTATPRTRSSTRRTPAT